MRYIRHAVIAAAAYLSFAGPAAALTSNPECVADAREEYILCKATCREEFQVDKDSCRNVDHACAEACRAGRQACVEGPLADLAACKASSKAILESDKQACRDADAQNPDPVALDACIDAAQVAHFQRKDSCREGVRDMLRNCRVSFRACIRACPPAAQ